MTVDGIFKELSLIVGVGDSQESMKSGGPTDEVDDRCAAGRGPAGQSVRSSRQGQFCQRQGLRCKRARQRNLSPPIVPAAVGPLYPLGKTSLRLHLAGNDSFPGVLFETNISGNRGLLSLCLTPRQTRRGCRWLMSWIATRRMAPCCCGSNSRTTAASER